VYALGPTNGTLTVRTGKGGAAAKAGHNLLIEVTRWSATLAEDSAELTADARSLRVREGTGGINTLDDGDKAGITQTIDEEVLKGAAIRFQSTSVARSGSQFAVSGELELAGVRAPLDFTLDVGEDGRVTGRAKVTQTNWKLKPFSALFGTLKVADDVEVAIDATLPRSPTDG
jgi:polyisoprenoid-binding protein YceI